MGTGSTYKAPSNNAWLAGQYYAGTVDTSLVGTSGATFYLTGVQLEVGDTATPFEHRSYGDELARCQRYYETSGGSVNAASTPNGPSCTQSTVISRHFSFAVEKRAAPTITETSVSVGSSGSAWANFGAVSQGKIGFLSRIISNVSTNSYGDKNCIWAADAEL